MSDENFLLEYEKLLDKGYCDCNEMNCLDNDTPRKILNIVKGAKLEAKQLLIENKQLKEQLQQKEDIINKAKELIHKHIKEIENLKLRIYPKEYYELLEILNIDKGDE